MDEASATAERLLEELAAAAPAGVELGTPQLATPPAAAKLTALGAPIVPYLLERAERGEPRVAAYAVRALGELGDRTLLAALARLRERYEGEQGTDPWRFAVIGQCRLASSALEARA